MRSAAFPSLLGVLLAGHAFVTMELASVRSSVAESLDLAVPPPAAVLKLLSLEYDNLAADLIFSRTLAFYGGKLNRHEPIAPVTYQALYRRLDAASDLDPYFVDPYYFGQSVLAWGANMPREANSLLDRGRRYRTEDWVMPFFMGFNEFYFLHDNVKASQYLMEASRRPNAEPLFGLLAARLAARGGTGDAAVVFLDELAARTEDRATREDIQRRAGALRGIVVLEQAVAHYRERYGTNPPDLRTLVDRGVLAAIPVDPYGGTYYLTAQGTIWTTSDLRPTTQ
jgi:hypothetical protein